MLAKQHSTRANDTHQTTSTFVRVHRFDSTWRTRQTARGIRIALRDTLPVIQHVQKLIVIAVTAACFMGAQPAHAESVSVFTGSLGGTSDFVFRGLSLTRGKPAAQASLDVEFPKEFYVGAFVATADPNPGPSPPVEMDFWAGRYWQMSQDFSGDLRLSQYTYPDDPRRVSYNRTELTARRSVRPAAMQKATPGRWRFPVAIRSTIVTRFRRALATTGSTRSITTATTTGT